MVVVNLLVVPKTDLYCLVELLPNLSLPIVGGPGHDLVCLYHFSTLRGSISE